MRFLIDADLPRSAAEVIRRHGHQVIDVRDIALGAAKDSEIADHARREGLCLITGDFDFSDVRNYPPTSYPGIVVLQLPRNATARFITELLDRFLAQEETVKQLPGRLAIVEPGRIRIRSR
jgi:predicted nuclease of predicted toxin-antitoxin system